MSSLFALMARATARSAAGLPMSRAANGKIELSSGVPPPRRRYRHFDSEFPDTVGYPSLRTDWPPSSPVCSPSTRVTTPLTTTTGIPTGY